MPRPSPIFSSGSAAEERYRNVRLPAFQVARGDLIAAGVEVELRAIDAGALAALQRMAGPESRMALESDGGRLAKKDIRTGLNDRCGARVLCARWRWDAHPRETPT